MFANLTTRAISALCLVCIAAVSNAQTNFNAGQVRCQQAIVDIYADPTKTGSSYSTWSRAFIEGYFYAKQRPITTPSFEAMTDYLVTYCKNTDLEKGPKGMFSRNNIEQAAVCWIDKTVNGSCTQGDPRR